MTTPRSATTRTDTTTNKRILTNRPAQVGPKTKTQIEKTVDREIRSGRRGALNPVRAAI